MKCSQCILEKKKCLDCLFLELEDAKSMYDQLVDLQTENEKYVVKIRCLVAENQAMRSIIAKQEQKMKKYKFDAYFK